MAIQCPHCLKKISLKSVRAGMFTPECPKCGAQFVLRVQVMSREERGKYKQQRALERRAVRKLEKLMQQPQPSVSASNETTTAALSKAQATGDASCLSLPDSAFFSSDADLAKPSKNGSLNGSHNNVASPATLGGYRVLKELGRGGMGAVYLAKQNSLNRQVAIKTIHPQLAHNPAFISRFTREAFAAAQLTHHNIVQVYDLAEDHQTHFFSMEYVDGVPLDKLLAERKQLESRTAIGFILQAARGLQFAHEHGMVHRDVKPANLMLNRHGIVKVADLGLVKTRESADGESGEALPAATASNGSVTGITTFGDSLGTPTYMAPEQCEDAAGVDHRADIYSLGCTLYALLTGRPPFVGRSAEEVIEQHLTSPVVPPIKLVTSIPPALSELCIQMLAKRPQERPADLGTVITQLEGMLEKSSSPVARYADTFAHWLSQFRGCKLATWRPRIIQALYGLAILLGVFLCARWQWIAGLSILAIPLVATVSYVFVRGLLDQSHLVGQLRKLLVSSRWMDYLIGCVVIAVVFGAIAILNLYIPAIVSTALGLAAAFAFYYALDRRIDSERQPAVQGAKDTLRQMRLEGMDETSIQRIAAEACGENWEEFFEQLFGYPAKRNMRKLLENERAGMRFHKYAVWRDKLVDAIDQRLDELEMIRQRVRMRKVEMAKLVAEGIPKSEARKRAYAESEIAIEHSMALRASSREFAVASAERRRALKQLVTSARNGNARRSLSIVARLRKLSNVIVGAKTRFACGVVLLILGLAWLHHNQVFSSLQQTASAISSVTDLSGLDVNQLGSNMASSISNRSHYEALPFLPGALGELFGCIGTSLAGLALIATAPCNGLKSLALALGAAAVAVLGPSLLSEYIPALPFSIPLLELSEVAAYLLSLIFCALSWWVSD